MPVSPTTTEFEKYEALGNDYLVTLCQAWADAPADNIARVCDRRRGIGADGVLVPECQVDQWSVRIFNADGSEAEKSGNGVRIAARFLVDRQCVAGPRVALATRGGPVVCELIDDPAAGNGCRVSGSLGQADFASDQAFVVGPSREMIAAQVLVAGQPLTVTVLSLGNPHCVVFRENLSREETERWGPLLESHDLFRHRTNVQFARIMDRGRLELHIWERGSGYTHSSGSSSAAAVCAAIRLGLVDRRVECHMPGGVLQVHVDDAYRATIVGPVRRIGSIRLSDGFWQSRVEA